MPSEFAQKVIDMLSPSIGEFMATRKVTTACDLASLKLEEVKGAQKKKFSEKLEMACASLGPAVAQSIRESVEALE